LGWVEIGRSGRSAAVASRSSSRVKATLMMSQRMAARAVPVHRS
jgi:hypothetical protein